MKIRSEVESFKFFVINLQLEPLPEDSFVEWSGGIGGDDNVSLPVSGLEPGRRSPHREFYPLRWHPDHWFYSGKPQDHYRLNIYNGDRHTAVVISEYGISVIPTRTAPLQARW